MGEEIYLHRFWSDVVSIYGTESFFFITEDPYEKEDMLFTESWTKTGCYLFAPQGYLADSDFFINVAEFWKRSSDYLLFVWISNPKEKWWNWESECIMAYEVDGTARTLGKYSQITMGKYRMVLCGTLSVQCENAGFLIRAAEEEKGFYMQLDQVVGQQVTPQLVLPMKGAQAGCLQGSVTVGMEGQSNVFEGMDVGIKYSRPLKNVKEGWKHGHVHTISSPVLFGDHAVVLDVSIHPGAKLDPALTRFAFRGETFQSAFIANTGKNLNLLTGGNAALVFEQSPISLAWDEKSSTYISINQYYLGLQGDFFFEDTANKVLCGLSGMEYIDLSRTEAKCITFVPHQNGFCQKTKDEQSHLSNVSTTAWLKFSQGGWYYCQSERAPLFSPKANVGLRLLEAPAAIMTTQSPALPVFCYTDCKSSESGMESIVEYEDLIYKERRAALDHPVERKLVQEQEQTGMTPQGLMAGISCESGIWNWIGLANTNGGQEPKPNLYLEQISEAFRNMFLQSKMFLSIDRKEDFLQLARPGDEFKIQADGWTFQVSPNDWRSLFGNENSCMILKYTDEKSIASFMGNNPILQEALKKCYDEKGNEITYYKEFLDTIHDPQFQGIVFLNCNVEQGTLPDQMAYLLKDIDPANLFAHHIILRGNKVVANQDGTYRMDQTNVSALIDYCSTGELACLEGSVPYFLSVGKFLLQIDNSVVTQFYCSVELFMTQLLGAKCVKRDTTTGNSLWLDGVCQQNGKQKEYVFRLREKGIYDLEKSVIDMIQIQGAQVTFPVEDCVQGMIALNGVMQTLATKECDLGSFGTDGKAGEIGGLLFEQMKINIPWQGNMAMTYESMHFSPESSQMRSQSFGSRFACTFDSLVIESAGTPDDLGFTSITCPIQQEKFEGPWNGMVWKLNLGSLGGLASSETFSIQLLFAWCKNEDGIAHYVGVKLPALLGGEGIDFQGILKLGFQTIELFAAGEEEMEYTLRLHNFSLRVLSLSFPKGASDIFIFADGKQLGWYAAYCGKEVDG